MAKGKLAGADAHIKNLFGHLNHRSGGFYFGRVTQKSKTPIEFKSEMIDMTNAAIAIQFFFRYSLIRLMKYCRGSRPFKVSVTESGISDAVP